MALQAGTDSDDTADIFSLNLIYCGIRSYFFDEMRMPFCYNKQVNAQGGMGLKVRRLQKSKKHIKKTKKQSSHSSGKVRK
jgi:hypothetical protein